ncbi:MAG: hypothetical protein KAI84_06745 [Gammaproteobacteria bacterium]|nr:hypothetical protein [Gammaproteobacteria bacterium]
MIITSAIIEDIASKITSAQKIPIPHYWTLKKDMEFQEVTKQALIDALSAHYELDFPEGDGV